MTSVYDQILGTLYGIWRRRWYGIATMWAVCLLGWGIVAAIPDTYEATARIYVDTNEALKEYVENGQSNNVAKQVDIVKRTLINHANLERVIRRTDLDLTASNESDTEKLIDQLAENISLKNQGEDLFTISYKSGARRLTTQENANLAKRVVQNLINIFVEDNMGGKRDTLNGVIRFLDERLNDLKGQLEQYEKAKADFERANKGFLDGPDNYQTRLAAARTEIGQLEQRLTELRSSRSALSVQLGSIPATIPGSTFVFQQAGGTTGGYREDPNSTAGRIEVMQRQLTENFAKGLTENHPDVVTIKSQISQLQKQLELEKRSAPKKAAAESAATQSNPVYVQTKMQLIQKDTDLHATEARYQQLRGEISNLDGKTETMPSTAAEKSKVDRDYEVTRHSYDEMLQKREKAKQALAAETGAEPFHIRIIDAPEVPLKPVAPNRPLLLSGVIIAGLILGIAASFILSQIHTTYLNVSKLRDGLNIPVLGSVSAILTEQQRNQTRMWLSMFLLAFGSLVVIYGVLMAIEITQRSTAI